MMSPHWIEQAEFVGDYKNSQTGYKGFEWNAKGLQDNLYYEIYDENHKLIPYKIFQKPQSNMTFDINTYTEAPINKSVFDLPTNAGNCESTCGLSSVCAAL